MVKMIVARTKYVHRIQHWHTLDQDGFNALTKSASIAGVGIWHEWEFFSGRLPVEALSLEGEPAIRARIPHLASLI